MCGCQGVVMWLQLFFGWLLGCCYVVAYVVCGFQGVAVVVNMLWVVSKVLLCGCKCSVWLPVCCSRVMCGCHSQDVLVVNM